LFADVVLMVITCFVSVVFFVSWIGIVSDGEGYYLILQLNIIYNLHLQEFVESIGWRFVSLCSWFV